LNTQKFVTVIFLREHTRGAPIVVGTKFVHEINHIKNKKTTIMGTAIFLKNSM